MAAAGNGNPSFGEIGRRLDRIEAKLDGLNFVHPETLDTKLMLVDALRVEHERRITGLEKRVEGFDALIEERRQRAISVWVAPVVVAVVAALIIAILIKGGP